MTEKSRRYYWATRKPLNQNNISTVPKQDGIYRLYKNGKCIYVGVAGIGKYGHLRHRLGSYIEEDDMNEHRSKRGLRNSKPDSFSYSTMPIVRARRLEMDLKKSTKFNMDKP